GTADRMFALAELCELVAGRVPLVIELKSRFDGDRRLVGRAATVLSGYRGAAAVMSFDPAQIAALRAIVPQLPRGVVAERRYRDERDRLLATTRRGIAYLGHLLSARPQFIAYSVRDLPAALPTLARNLLRLPLLAWTVRNADDRSKAERFADQMIFEGF